MPIAVAEPSRYSGKRPHKMCSRRMKAREPFAVSWVAACSIMALLTGSKEIKMNISTMPPAMPTMPDKTLVAKALAVISAQSRGENIIGKE